MAGQSGGGISAGGFMQIAGAGTQAFGTIMSGQAAAAQGSATSKISKYNAAQLFRAAKNRRDSAKIELAGLEREQAMFAGEQSAEMGASGLGGATDIEILADTEYQASMDRNLLMRGALMESQSMESEAYLTLQQGQFAKRMGMQQRGMAWVSAAGSILSGAGGAMS